MPPTSPSMFLLLLSLVALLLSRVAAISFSVSGAPTAFQSISALGTKLYYPPSVLTTTTYYTQAGTVNRDIILPFPITFDATTSMNLVTGMSVQVAHNGDIFLNDGGNSFAQIQRPLNSNLGDGRIAVINCNRFYGGSIYYLLTTSSVIVSYEGMTLNTSYSDTISAQAEIFTNGDVELRYSDLTSLHNQTCTMGIGDSLIGDYQAFEYGTCTALGECTTVPTASNWLFCEYFI